MKESTDNTAPVSLAPALGVLGQFLDRVRALGDMPVEGGRRFLGAVFNLVQVSGWPIETESLGDVDHATPDRFPLPALRTVLAYAEDAFAEEWVDVETGEPKDGAPVLTDDFTRLGEWLLRPAFTADYEEERAVRVELFGVLQEVSSTLGFGAGTGGGRLFTELPAWVKGCAPPPAYGGKSLGYALDLAAAATQGEEDRVAVKAVRDMGSAAPPGHLARVCAVAARVTQAAAELAEAVPAYSSLADLTPEMVSGAARDFRPEIYAAAVRTATGQLAEEFGDRATPPPADLAAKEILRDVLVAHVAAHGIPQEEAEYHGDMIGARAANLVHAGLRSLGWHADREARATKTAGQAFREGKALDEEARSGHPSTPAPGDLALVLEALEALEVPEDWRDVQLARERLKESVGRPLDGRDTGGPAVVDSVKAEG